MLFNSKLPLPSIPNEENTNKFQCWGWGVGGRGLAPQTLEGCPSTQDKNRGSLHIGQRKGSLKERYGNTKATVEHNTMG